MGDTAIGGEVRGRAILTGVTRLVIAPDEEDPVVGARRDGERHQHIGGKGRQFDHVVHRQECDNASRGGQFDADHGQQQGHRDERSVDEKQHHEDHRDRGDHDLHDRLVAAGKTVGRDSGRTGDVGLHPLRRGDAVHDLADGSDGVVGRRLALIANEIQLNIGGFAVGTLRARRGERITPEVLDVLHIFRVGLQPADDVLVVVMRVVAELVARPR